MKTHPIRAYAEPSFPTRTALDAHPELLRLVPQRWRSNAIVLAALTTAGMLVAGCRMQLGQAAETGSKEKTPVSRIAPLFVTVEERTNYPGGIKAPPIYLSEAEARQVILEEAKTAGITFTPDSQTLKDLPVLARKDAAKSDPTKFDLALDGTNARRKIAFEFVSEEDRAALRTEKVIDPAACYDSGHAAKTLREVLVQARPEGTYALFCDPDMSDKKAAQEALRKQVRDFIGWLKAQGVI